MSRKSDKNVSAENIVSSFEQEIARQEDIIYGVALFFECLSVIHGDQPAVVETNRKQFRNIIQNGKEMTGRATRLLEEARRDPAKAELLRGFAFSPCLGHPKPGEMIKRALVLVNTYNRIFPGRDRSRDFTYDETIALIEQASEALQ